MSVIIIDVETAPLPDLDAAQLAYLERIEKSDGAALSPLTGQIVCIGVLDVSTNYVEKIVRGVARGANGPMLLISESVVIRRFWEMAKTASRIVTYNGRAFDIPFLLMRSAILGVPVSRRDLMGYRYSASPHCDLLDQLTFYGATPRFPLDMACRAFGIPSPKTGITGADVPRLFAEGRHAEIAEYNMADLRAQAALCKVWVERIADPRGN